jgi:hypothetical protein
MWYNMLALLAFLLVGLTISSPIHKRQAAPPGCVDIIIPVTASADNTVLPVQLDTANFILLLDPLLFNVVSQLDSGSFNIAATYCPPAVSVPGRSNTLQVLVHG